MAQIHNLGFPRIGARRELKFAQENFWQGKIDEVALEAVGQELRAKNWQIQQACDLVPVGDFSLYDHVLDTSFMLGHVPERVNTTNGSELEHYFRVARGRANTESDCACVQAGEMTKWFDTNYHYIVPELTAATQFKLNANRIVAAVKEAQAQGHVPKPVILGPVTYLWLSKIKTSQDTKQAQASNEQIHQVDQRLGYLDELTNVYAELLDTLGQLGVEWVQIDEPLLVTELDTSWQDALLSCYATLNKQAVKILIATYFGDLQDNSDIVSQLPVDGLHLDIAAQFEQQTKSASHTAHPINNDQLAAILKVWPSNKVLSLGVMSGRNIWKTDLNALLNLLEPVAQQLKNNLWLAPSCSLLHVPVDLNSEEKMDSEIKNWLAFAVQKLEELHILKQALNNGRESVQQLLDDNQQAIASRQASTRVHNPAVQQAVQAINNSYGQRQSVYEQRQQAQKVHLSLPEFPTTTIGSFPQTQDIRKTRLAFKKGQLSYVEYKESMHQEIKRSVREQEELGLDVLVHGEAERNDMVEYFGEQLNGYVFSQFGWVQSYGSRCVKPPIIFGDINRPKPMTVEWIQYAQSLTDKPLKAMLTGPVTILNWSFVRDDQPRSETCNQIALAIRDEVLDLEQAGMRIIQIDEAALREGLPLRQSQWQEYLQWAVEAFRICANGVQDATQIHTHMCYSEFNDIIEAIAQMDADVITIETSRSDMELLDVFDQFKYPNEIGPGVYDIHSPNIPTEDSIVELMTKAAQRIPRDRLWINPDCGLKTRRWEEVLPALQNMVQAAKRLRA